MAQVQQLALEKAAPVQEKLTLEKVISQELKELDTRIRKFLGKHFGARKVPYTVPAKPTANAVDIKRLKKHNDTARIHKTAEEMRKLAVRMSREVQEAQGTEFCLQLLKARQQDVARQSSVSARARAQASADSQKRAAAAATFTPLSIAQVRSYEGKDDGFAFPESDEEVDIR